MDEESAAGRNFRLEDAIHDVSYSEAEDVRSHGLPLVESVRLKYCAVLLPHLNVAYVKGAVEEEEIFQCGEVERVTCLSISAAEDYEGSEAGEGGVCILNVDAYHCVRGRLEINSEKYVSRSCLCA